LQEQIESLNTLQILKLKLTQFYSKAWNFFTFIIYYLICLIIIIIPVISTFHMIWTEIQNILEILKNPHNFLLTFIYAYAFKSFYNYIYNYIYTRQIVIFIHSTMYNSIYTRQIVILILSALFIYSCSAWVSNYILLGFLILLIGSIFINRGILLIKLGKKNS